MSNPPPPSSTLGTHFSPNGHMESPAGSCDYDLPEYQYPYQNPSFLYGQGQMNGTPIAPHTNSNHHSFRANAQGLMDPRSGNEVNGAPYAFYGRQIEYRAFQTPADPPIPFAHGVPSHAARHLGQPSTNSTLPSNSSTLFPDPQPAAQIQSTNITNPETVPPASSELEDGELDDEEAGQVTGHSRASTTTPSAFSQHKRHKNLRFTDSEPNRYAANATNQPLPGLNQGKLLPPNTIDVSESGFLGFSVPDSLATPNSQGFTTSQTHQYPMPNSFIGNSDNSQFSRTAESTSVHHQLLTNNGKPESREVNQQLVDQKMEEAKQALRDLLSQGFDFNQIVSAGLNPDVLRELCNKIEVPVTASSDMLQRKIAKPGVVGVPNESAIAKTHDPHTELPQKDLEGGALGNDTLPHLVTEEIKINSQPTLAAANNEERLMRSQASLAKSSTSSNVIPLGKASAIKAGGTKLLDRKEYIARMLAAKAGKRAVSASIPVSSRTPPISDTASDAQVRSSATAAPIIPATDLQGPSDSIDTTLGAQKEDSDIESKRKAQTDLARQKIEALKLRGSFEQQARSTNSSDVRSNSQQDPVEGVATISGERSAPSSRPLPSRQSSYFSPASQKPPFSIPGLFMTSDPLEPASSSKPLPNENPAVSWQRVGDGTFGSSQEGLRPHAAVSAQSPIVNKTSSLPQTSLGSNSALPATISTTTSSNRKRQRASDFTDSPSTRVKRPLGQQEDTSVIIDISDDEISNDTSGDESLDTADCRDSVPRKSQVTASGNGKKDPTKNLPSLTDLPQRNRSVMMTPPAVQASAQSGDVNGLRSKEMEIEVMNRKIAELEQRIAIKAKQTTSRSHSPGTSSRLTISPPPGGASHQINDPPHIPSSLSDSQNGDVARVDRRGSFTALAEIIETAAADQLNAEQQLEHVERAKAEAERSLVTDAESTVAAAADQSLTREESIQSPRVEEQTNSRGGEQRSMDEEQERVQVEAERCLEESQSRQARGQETKRFRQEGADSHLEKQEQTLAQGARQEQERKRSLDDQQQARKSELESGLPLLDAEVDKTRKRLESLRQEMAGLETQLQKGIEGRKGLIAELHILSRSRKTLPGPMDLDIRDVSDIAKQSTNTEESPAVTEPSASVEVVAKFDPAQFSGTVGGGTEVREKDTSMQTTEGQMSGGEVEDDIMDISRSDVDEAELSLYSPKAVTEDRDTSGFVDDDENYEPPSEIGITQRNEPDSDGVSLSQNLETANAILPTQTQNQPSTNLSAKPIERPTSGESSPVVSVDMAGDDQLRRSLSHSPSLANASDPDDYEPPEPASSGDEVLRCNHMSSVGSETHLALRDVETNKFVADASSDSIPAVNQQVQKHESIIKVGHFTPYESPLKQFKSFRYHPRYLEEVSSGFRSLTYSHTINPDIPLCRYELDGVCNDDSCQNQHLRSVGLSDDKILVDLGAKPDNGSSPDEFGNGLREIIHDIRSRKIRDFNIVAGEITAYRAKFLGDSTKVLPL